MAFKLIHIASRITIPNTFKSKFRENETRTQTGSSKELRRLILASFKKIQVQIIALMDQRPLKKLEEPR